MADGPRKFFAIHDESFDEREWISLRCIRGGWHKVLSSPPTANAISVNLGFWVRIFHATPYTLPTQYRCRWCIPRPKFGDKCRSKDFIHWALAPRLSDPFRADRSSSAISHSGFPSTASLHILQSRQGFEVSALSPIQENRLKRNRTRVTHLRQIHHKTCLHVIPSL